jgi:hypothetical protein
MHIRIAIDFGCRGLQVFAFTRLAAREHVNRLTSHVRKILTTSSTVSAELGTVIEKLARTDLFASA